ncbi:MAG: group 1 truncated hemoglobin [Terracidiphilus sp.]
MALYDDIGGAPAVRAALDAFYPRVLADEMLSPFFAGVDIDRLKATQEGFFSMALGGPNTYTGRSLGDAHAHARHQGMNDDVFNRFLHIFKGVLSDLEVPADKIAEIFVVFEGGRNSVLNR